MDLSSVSLTDALDTVGFCALTLINGLVIFWAIKKAISIFHDTDGGGVHGQVERSFDEVSKMPAWRFRYEFGETKRAWKHRNSSRRKYLTSYF